MAASTNISKGAVISKTDYLKRYLSADEDGKKAKEKKIRKKRPKPSGRGMKIVDDDVDWKQLVRNSEEKEDKDEDDEEAPVIAEIVDERPEEVKLLEAFRTSNKWRVMGAPNDEFQEEKIHGARHDSPDASPAQRIQHDSPDFSPKRNCYHNSPDLSLQRKNRHDSPNLSPQRNRRHDSPDLSPQRKSHHDSPDLSPQRKRRHDSPDLSPPRQRPGGGNRRYDSTSPSPPRKLTKTSHSGSHKQDSSKWCPRTQPSSDSDLSPPRRGAQAGRDSDSDLSPPCRTQNATRMLSGGAAGLVSVETLKKEQDEIRRREKQNQPLEEDSRNAETVFRDRSGRRRDLESERVEQSRKAGEKAEKDEKYAQWGKGLAQSLMQQQNVTDALREAQKPLARHIDDEDLDRMLREQEREGDPMAAMLRRKKEKTAKLKGVRERPRYNGPAPPPNRFNIMPGYRWDGVDRSNGFEQKRYSRMSDKKALQEVAYKWSVEDM
ncbi:BUD13 homolog [Chanos chanos]|uniref:BUD13 homolog n=1 Tax=Chanos chanos TaxID=29144 RepID=A0A6J2W1Z2_CHACN|nr:BUD13 homolog [Chanos chanos]